MKSKYTKDKYKIRKLNLLARIGILFLIWKLALIKHNKLLKMENLKKVIYNIQLDFNRYKDSEILSQVVFKEVN